MSFETISSPESGKEEWLGELCRFIGEAGKHGWAAEAPKVDIPQRPGFKEIAYSRDDWDYRDSYAGYYMGPGSSVVYFKGKPVWHMSYGGDGQAEEHFDKSKETYQFLRRALSQPHPDLPIRGPHELHEDDWMYSFDYVGNIENATWDELIDKGWERVFAQDGIAGLIIDKDENRQPVYPWNL